MDIIEVIEKSEQNHFLLGLLFGNIKFSEKSARFYIYSSYRNNNVIKITDGEIEDTHQSLQNKTGLDWLNKNNQNQALDCLGIKRVKHLLVFENNKDINYLNAYNKLLTLVKSCVNIDISEFFAGFFSCRTSPDQNRRTVTIDFWYNSNYELETKIRALFNLFPLSDLSAVFPVNFRELQQTQIDGAGRKTQFRIKANWFYQNSYLINPYKQKALKKIVDTMKAFTSSNTIPDLLSRVKDFSSIIYAESELNEQDIEKHRRNIGLDADSPIENIRDKKLVEIAWEILPDECAGCNQKYKINDRTFLSKKRAGRPYLEIHHIISLGRNKKLDTEFNLSKLCPACHTSLRRNRATLDTQKEVISNILNYSLTDTESIKNYLEIFDDEQVINTIQQKLL